MRSPRDSRAESASRHRRSSGARYLLAIGLCILVAAALLGVAAPARAADGTISGTVWEGFGVSLPGVTVTAYHFDGGAWTAVAGGTDTTDVNGDYALTVPVATGYHVGFAKTGYVDQWWANKATQTAATAIDNVSATVDVTGINATLAATSSFVTTVDAVTGTEPMDGTLTIAWHSSATLAIDDAGVFWYWVRSAGGADWYMQGSLTVLGYLTLPGRNFEADIAHMAVPDAAGYQIVVGYDPNGGAFDPDDITSWGTSTGSFAVRAGLTVDTPVPATYGATDDPMQVVWQTTAPISSGSFGIWARSSSLANWYEVTVFPWNQALSRRGSHLAGFTDWTYTLTSLHDADPAVPVGTGYQIIVAWEPNVWSTTGGTPVTTWSAVASTPTLPSGPMCWATSPGSIDVTAGSTIEITSVTSPSTGEYALGDDMTITWTTNITNTADDQFGVWARSTNLTSWYRLYAAPPFHEAVLGRTTFTHDITLAGAYAALNWIPPGTYQIVVACHSGHGAPPWDSFGTSVGSFTVVE